MALVAFRDQVEKYSAEGKTDFRRVNLVYAFQDLVASLKNSSDITEEVISEIESLMKIHQTDSNFMKGIGFDIIEASIKLQLLVGLTSFPVLKNLAVAIAFSSNPKELLIELNALMTYVKLENEKMPIEMFKDLTLEQMDIFKTIATFYLTTIVQRIEEKNLKITMQELYIYAELLEHDMENSNSVLGSNLITEFFQAISTRVLQIKINALEAAVKFLMRMIVIYEKIGKFKEFQQDAIKVLCRLTGDISQIIQSCKGQTDYSDPILILSNLAYKGTIPELDLPYVLSGNKRFQILLPNSIKGCSSFPSLFTDIFTHTVWHLEENLQPEMLESTCSGAGYVDFFINVLDLCGGMLPNDSKKLYWGLLKEVLKKLVDSRKAEVALKILQGYQWDIAKGMILDWVCSEALLGKIPEKEALKIVNEMISMNHGIDQIETLQAALRLHRVLTQRKDFCEATLNSEIQEKCQKLYTDFSHAYDLNPSVPKLGLILIDLQQVQLHKITYN